MEAAHGRSRGEVGMGVTGWASIVLADDDEDLRAVYAPCLRASGYTVWEASGGSEAIDLVRRHRPALLILDVWMPHVSGFEVLEQLRHDPASSGLKVMMLSNLVDGDTRLECFEMGAVEYVVKGLSLVELRARVAGLLAEGPSLVPNLDAEAASPP
jgi:DNA-binding response OmpR family regulator